jgi:hypothetical protein
VVKAAHCQRKNINSVFFGGSFFFTLLLIPPSIVSSVFFPCAGGDATYTELNYSCLNGPTASCPNIGSIELNILPVDLCIDVCSVLSFRLPLDLLSLLIAPSLLVFSQSQDMDEADEEDAICSCYPCQDEEKAALLLKSLVDCIRYEHPKIQSGDTFFVSCSSFFVLISFFFFCVVTWMALGTDAEGVIKKITSEYLQAGHPQLYSNKALFSKVPALASEWFLFVLPCFVLSSSLFRQQLLSPKLPISLREPTLRLSPNNRFVHILFLFLAFYVSTTLLSSEL